MKSTKVNIKVGDRVIFRYADDWQSKTTANEWYDFKDEIDYLYSGQYDVYTWQSVFNRMGTVVKISCNIITVFVENVGEMEGSEKIIKVISNKKTSFRIKADLSYDKI